MKSKKQINQIRRDHKLFEKGDRIICVDVGSWKGYLTLGKEYVVKNIRKNFLITVDGDNGKEITLGGWRFEYPEYFRRSKDLLWNFKNESKVPDFIESEIKSIVHEALEDIKNEIVYSVEEFEYITTKHDNYIKFAIIVNESVNTTRNLEGELEDKLNLVDSLLMKTDYINDVEHYILGNINEGEVIYCAFRLLVNLDFSISIKTGLWDLKKESVSDSYIINSYIENGYQELWLDALSIYQEHIPLVHLFYKYLYIKNWLLSDLFSFYQELLEKVDMSQEELIKRIKKIEKETYSSLIKILENNPTFYKKYKDELELDTSIEIPNWIKRSGNVNLWNFKEFNESKNVTTPNQLLIDGATGGSINRVIKAVEKGANINYKYSANENETALIIASFYGYYDIVRYLVEHGADVTHIDNHGDNALSTAYEKTFESNDYEKIIDYLSWYIINNLPNEISKNIKYIPDKYKQKYPDLFRSVNVGLWDLKKENIDQDIRIGEYVICINNSNSISSGKEIDFYKDLLTVGKEYEIVDLPELNGILGRLITVIGDNGKRIDASVKRFKVQDFMARGKKTGLWDIRVESKEYSTGDIVLVNGEKILDKYGLRFNTNVKVTIGKVLDMSNLQHAGFIDPDYIQLDIIDPDDGSVFNTSIKNNSDCIIKKINNKKDIDNIISKYPYLFNILFNYMTIEQQEKYKYLKRSKKVGLWDFKEFKKYNENKEEMTPMRMLYKGISGNDIERVKQALDNDADIEYIKSDLPQINNTPLIIATYNGRYEIVKYLIKRGAKVNGKNKVGDTALIYAAYYGKMDILEYLLEQGADVFYRGSKHDTALEAAFDQGQSEIIVYLSNYIIEHYPDRVKEVEEFIPEDIKKEHPDLFRSIKTGLWDLKKENAGVFNYDLGDIQKEISKFLNHNNNLSTSYLKYTVAVSDTVGPALNGEKFYLNSTATLTLNNGNTINMEFDLKFGPLVEGIIEGVWNILKKRLPEEDFTITLISSSIKNTIQEEVYRKEFIFEIKPHWLQRSKRSGLWDFKKFNEYYNIKKEYNHWLMEAIGNGNLDSVMKAVIFGADVNYEDVFSKTTPLMKALNSGFYNEKIVEFLIKHGANVNHQDINGNTPLIKFATNTSNFFWNYIKTVDYLISKGADVFIKNIDGYTIFDFLYNIENDRSKKLLYHLCEYVIKNHSDRIAEIAKNVPKELKEKYPKLFRSHNVGLWNLKTE